MVIEAIVKVIVEIVVPEAAKLVVVAPVVVVETVVVVELVVEEVLV